MIATDYMFSHKRLIIFVLELTTIFEVVNCWLHIQTEKVVAKQGRRVITRDVGRL